MLLLKQMLALCSSSLLSYFISFACIKVKIKKWRLQIKGVVETTSGAKMSVNLNWGLNG